MKLSFVFIIASLALLVSAVEFYPSCNQEGGLVIDDFTRFRNFNSSNAFEKLEILNGQTGVQTRTTNPRTGAAGNYNFVASTFPVSATGYPNRILGGYRDMILYLASSSSSAGQGARVNINPGILSLSTDEGVTSIAEIQWDGNTDSASPATFNRVGLGGRDVTLGGSASSFEIVLSDTDLPISLRVEAYSYANGVASASRGVFFEWDPSVTSSREFEFSDFVSIDGNSINPLSVFQSLGAMRLFISSTDPERPEIDLVIFSIGIPGSYCIVKSVAMGTSSTPFNLFTGSSSTILTDNCAATNQAVAIGDTLTFAIQVSYDLTSNEVLTVMDPLDANFILTNNPFSYAADLMNGTVTQVAALNAQRQLVWTIRPSIVNGEAVGSATLFYRVTVSASSYIDSQTCQGFLTNRATLMTPDTQLLSQHWTGTTALDRFTRVCVRAAPELNLVQNVSSLEISAGETFTVSSVYSNSGDIATGDLTMTIELTGGLTQLVNPTGWSCDGILCRRTVAGVAVGASASMSSEIAVRSVTNLNQVSITCCIRTMTSVPDFCQSQSCQSFTVGVGGNPDVKILKRGRMVRQIEYSVDFFNVGTGAATGVVVTEQVPAGTTFNAGMSDGRWDCDDSGACVANVDQVGSRAADCAVFVVDIDNDTAPCTIFENDAFVSATNDMDLEDNYDSVITQEPGCQCDN